jgi:hypothetical protein
LKIDELLKEFALKLSFNSVQDIYDIEKILSDFSEAIIDWWENYDR